jgi:outer membrane immunogenic protein
MPCGGSFGDGAAYALSLAHSAENAIATAPSVPATVQEGLGESMPKFLSGAAFAFAAATIASASALADDVAKPLYKTAPAAPVYNWTGFYIGGNAGYGWGRSKTADTFTSPAPPVGVAGVVAASTSRFKMDGAVGGGQIGYNWQSDRFVYGIEADIQLSDQKGSTSFACPVPQLGQGCNELVAAAMEGLAPTASFNQRLDWFGTLRGRIGALVTPDTLIYGTGGLARGRIETNGIIANYFTTSVAITTFAHKSTRYGWTAGAGVESRLIGNWTAKLEYLYLDLGTVSGSTFATGFTPLIFAYSSRISENIVRIGLNYRFGDAQTAR